MLYDNILQAIGNTPLIRLEKLSPQDGATIFAKFEGVNIGGSIKIRSALRMIEKAEKQGILKKDSRIVEVSSGNQGISLALIGTVKGYPVTIIMPDTVSKERRKLIQQYGAEIILIKDEGDIGLCFKQCQELAVQMAKDDPNVFLPLQFENKENVMAQRAVGEEIISDLSQIDGFTAGIGTGGTISGVGAVLKEHFPNIHIWAVEPQKAAILTHGEISSHIQMGIGDGIIPDILDLSIYEKVCVISDEEALFTAKLLAKKEGILAGISSGSNLAAAIRLAKTLKKDQAVVTILPDTGERYFSTALFD